ncbi:hypothetical protein NC652_039114 [Populus alba x Populus x berolinensis]|nr:hypothetical protein NC652_039114 [Populus alba x Populus x berolinensis]
MALPSPLSLLPPPPPLIPPSRSRLSNLAPFNASFLANNYDSLNYISVLQPVPRGYKGVRITYGSVIKLMHGEDDIIACIQHDVPYGSGKWGSNLFTGFPNIVRASTKGQMLNKVTQIKSGTIIRLQHMKTRKWLHSHLHASPISGNLEISCFGERMNLILEDYWREWKDMEARSKDSASACRHPGLLAKVMTRNTNELLGSSMEVCGFREKRADNVWLAARRRQNLPNTAKQVTHTPRTVQVSKQEPGFRNR